MFSLKACRNDFRCKSGPRILGIDGSDPKNSHGENWARLGLYKDGDLSREIREELLYLPEAHYGVAVSPIEKLEDFPDTVLFIVNPYQAMRILQGYAYFYGSPKSLRMIGNQALCQECTARPFGTKDLNVSLLCIGTRHRTGWKDEEMAVGLPKEQFTSVVEGLMQTLNPMESDANKRIIEKKLQKKGIPFSVRYGYNYYMDC